MKKATPVEQSAATLCMTSSSMTTGPPLTEMEEAWLPLGMWWEKWNDWKPSNQVSPIISQSNFDFQSFISNDIAGLLVFCNELVYLIRTF